MKALLFFVGGLLTIFILNAQEDDVYFTPEKKKKPLKDRKMYTSIDQRKPMEGNSLYFMSAPTNTFWDIEEKEIYLYVFLQGQEYKVEKERPRFNISFVIDRSGSMQGRKISDTKKALNFAIDQLGELDYISIVQYNDKIETVLEPTLCTNKELLHEKVESIFATGSTNLNDGMIKGFEHVKSMQPEFNDNNVIHRVILISDGLANTGVVSPDAIAENARSYYQENNVTISTIGVGADYNEDLMTKISIEGGGAYHFIESTDDLSNIFDQEFNELKTLVAKNSILKINYPMDKVRFDKVYEYPYNLKDNIIEIKMTDFFAEQQKSILIKFRVRDDYESDIEFETVLEYDNIVADNEHIKQSVLSMVKPTLSEKDIASGIVADAHMGYTLMISSDYLKLAQEASDNRNFVRANMLVENGLAILDDHFYYVVPNPYLEDIYKELEGYKTNITKLEKTKDPFQFKLIQKSSKSRRYRGSYKSVRFM